MKQYNAQEYRHCWGKTRKNFDNKSNFEKKKDFLKFWMHVLNSLWGPYIWKILCINHRKYKDFIGATKTWKLMLAYIPKK